MKLVNGRYAEETVSIGTTYLGEQSITMNGASQAATLPTGTNFVEVSAEGGPVRFAINATASANSGGYVPDGMVRYTLNTENLTSLALFGAAPAIAHLIYRQEP